MAFFQLYSVALLGRQSLQPTVGLAAVLEFMIVGPELKPNKINNDEVNKKKPGRYSSAGTAADSEQKDEDLFVSQHNSKPFVGCRYFFCFKYFILKGLALPSAG